MGGKVSRPISVIAEKNIKVNRTVEVDLLIVGAGSAGITAAKFASKGEGGLGYKVALAENRKIGGDCTWYGCVPSKSIIHKAKLAHFDKPHAKSIAATVGAHIDAVQADIYKEEDDEVFEARDVVVLKGSAKLVSGQSAVVTEEKGYKTEVLASNILICTGAEPKIPPIKGLNNVPFWTYESLWEALKQPGVTPAKIAVFGSGPIGSELSQALARLGWEVFLIGSKILPRDCDSVREVMTKAFDAEENLTFISGRPSSVEKTSNGIKVAINNDMEINVDRVLVSTGRSPNTHDLGLEDVGIKMTENKGIWVNGSLQTNIETVWACGDCLGGPQFTHYAGWQAFYAVRNILLPSTSPGFPKINPWVTFTDPEVAQVGLTCEDAQKKYGSDCRIETMLMSEVDRGRTDEATKFGEFITLIFNGDKIVGATMVCPRAGELISEVGVSIANGLTATQMAKFIHPYPAYSFAIFQICGKVAQDSIFKSSVIGAINNYRLGDSVDAGQSKKRSFTRPFRSRSNTSESASSRPRADTSSAAEDSDVQSRKK